MSIALNGDMPTHVRGSRSAMSNAASGLVATFPDEMRAELMADRFRLRWLSALEAGIGQCDRTCMRIYAESVKLVGGQMDLAAAIIAAVGVGAEVARASQESVERARQMPDSAKCASMLDWLRKHGVEGVESLTIPESLQASSAEVMP